MSLEIIINIFQSEDGINYSVVTNEPIDEDGKLVENENVRTIGLADSEAEAWDAIIDSINLLKE